MNANIPKEHEITAGTIVAKGPYYYIVMSWYEPMIGGNGEVKTKKRTKWLSTKITLKEPRAKNRAKDMLLLVRNGFRQE